MFLDKLIHNMKVNISIMEKKNRQKILHSPVVSDADVIIQLSKLGRLYLLRRLYNKIAIPEYVKCEILQKECYDIQRAIGSYLTVYRSSNERAIYFADKYGIHIGEAHVKVLGDFLKSNLMLSNERKLRKIARQEGFNVAGTIGIILKAYRTHLINRDDILLTLDRMKDDEFWIHPDLIQQAISAISY